MSLKSAGFCLIIVFCLLITSIGIVRADELPIDLKLNAGYRLDNLRWNIAGDLWGENPNILSELSWTDLQILQIEALPTAHIGESLFLQGFLKYGIIILGNNQDSDYLSDNRTEEFSRSNNSGNGGYTLDISIAIGHYLTRPDNKFRLATMIGYAFNQQSPRMTDGYQTISNPDYETPDIGPFTGLKSSYKATWNGPWCGIGLTGNPNPKWTIFSDFEYHWANYYGEGNWNLRDDLAHPISFTHTADGTGYRWSAGANFISTSQLGLTLKYYSTAWSAGPGIDRVIGAGGATGTTRLNEVFWSSQTMILTIRAKP